MKRAFAQRLVFILFSVALTSIALAAPPGHAEGSPPPFNEADCVFERGRTFCEAVVASGAGSTSWNAYPNEECGWDWYKMVERSTERVLVVYYGTSHVVDYEEVFTGSTESEEIFVYNTCGLEPEV